MLPGESGGCLKIVRPFIERRTCAGEAGVARDLEEYLATDFVSLKEEPACTNHITKRKQAAVVF